MTLSSQGKVRTKIAEMSALYELEKKEQEIQILNQRDEINNEKLKLQETQIKLSKLFFVVHDWKYRAFARNSVYLISILQD